MAINDGKSNTRRQEASTRGSIVFEHIGSLITRKIKGKDHALGFLIVHPQHGVYDAELGKVNITPSEAETHNQLLSRALIEGLDKCTLGQTGIFYMMEVQGQNPIVKTWIGDVVSASLVFEKKTIAGTPLYTFRRGEHRYRVEPSAGDDDDSCVVTRIG